MQDVSAVVTAADRTPHPRSPRRRTTTFSPACVARPAGRRPRRLAAPAPAHEPGRVPEIPPVLDMMRCIVGTAAVREDRGAARPRGVSRHWAAATSPCNSTRTSATRARHRGEGPKRISWASGPRSVRSLKSVDIPRADRLNVILLGATRPSVPFSGRTSELCRGRLLTGESSPRRQRATRRSGVTSLLAPRPGEGDSAAVVSVGRSGRSSLYRDDRPGHHVNRKRLPQLP